MKKSINKGVFLAIVAATLYAINSPFSKILLDYMPSTLMAGFLYIGAGVGMLVIAVIRKARHIELNETRLTKKELPYTIAMIVLDIAAPISLLFGLKSTSSANASLLNNFEIVATAIIVLMIFKEKISLRLWAGIAFVTVSCLLLSVEDFSSFQFSYGSLFIIIACVCWGFENNCTRKISSKDPLQIVLLKGIFSGIGSIIIGLCRRKNNCFMECFCRIARRIRCIRIKYFLLCPRTKIIRCSKDKCVLCGCSVYRHNFVSYYI